MLLSRSKIIFSIILLLSWSVFITPAFSVQIAEAHHQISIQMAPCHDGDCNIQMTTSCMQHCEASQAIMLSVPFSASNSSTNNHLLIDHNDKFSFIQLVELKPPIHF